MDSSNYSSESWQVDSEKLSERLQNLVGNPLRADFEFYIEQDNVKIPAHKLIISAGSPVLEKIVYGTNQFDGVNSSIVDDISAAGFTEIIRYLYTDHFVIEDYDGAIEIMKKANYFCLSHVEQRCKDYLIKHIDLENVSKIYTELQFFYPYDDIISKCLLLIQLNGQIFLDNIDYSMLDLVFLKNILKLDAIDCSEVDLYKSMHKWAEVWCIKTDKPVTSTNKRKIVDGAEHLIRLSTLKFEDFEECLKIDGQFLSETEIEEIKSNILSGKSNEKKRKYYTCRDSKWISVDYSAGDFEFPTSVTVVDLLNDDLGVGLITRVKIGNELCPAKVYHSAGILMYDKNRMILESRPFELLIGNGYKYKDNFSSASYEIPENAVVIDYDSNSEPVFYGRYFNDDTYEMELIRICRNMEPVENIEILVCDIFEKPITNVDNCIPENAIYVDDDADGNAMYVGKTWHELDLLPAIIVPQRRVALTPWNCAEHIVEKYEFVCKSKGSYKWLPTKNGEQCDKAVECGFTAYGEILFIGRVQHEGHYYSGKVHSSHKVMYIPFNGQEIAFSNYDILVEVDIE